MGKLEPLLEMSIQLISLTYFECGKSPGREACKYSVWQVINYDQPLIQVPNHA